MARFERRIRRLEAQLTDLSGLVPHAKPWFDYWTASLDKLSAGEEVEEKFPMGFFDALIAGAQAEGPGHPTGSDCSGTGHQIGQG